MTGRVATAPTVPDYLRSAGRRRFIEFTAQLRMSGVDLADGTVIRKGAPDAVIKHVTKLTAQIPKGCQEQVDSVGSKGATPLLVSKEYASPDWSCWKTF